MKSKLEIAREIINDVDKQMIELFKKRMKAASLVAEYKKENNLPIVDSKREQELLSENLALLSDKELEAYYVIFFEGLLDASKTYQKDLIS